MKQLVVIRYCECGSVALVPRATKWRNGKILYGATTMTIVNLCAKQPCETLTNTIPGREPED